MVTIWAILKNITFQAKTTSALFWLLLEKIGLLLIPISGHTSCELKLILSFTQNRDEGSSAKNKTFLGRALGRSDAILSGQCYKAPTIFNYNQCGQILQNFSL